MSVPERCNVLHWNIRLERTFSCYGCDGASTNMAVKGAFRTRCALVSYVLVSSSSAGTFS